jgi:hypothetical protein
MLGLRVRKLIDKTLDTVGKKLGLFGVNANSVTIFWLYQNLAVYHLQLVLFKWEQRSL